MDDLRAAVLARTSVACARVAALTTYGRQPRQTLTTAVAVQPRADGSVEVALSSGAAAVHQLSQRPLASVRVAPPWSEPVVLHGAARRVRDAGRPGRAVFHVAAAAVRLGHDRVTVDAGRYAGCAPDPLRLDAPDVLTHLNGVHGDALTACLRARGHDAAFVLATALDAAGLTVVVVEPAGVSTVRLQFPHPVARLQDLPGGLAAVVHPRCGCCDAHGGPSR